MTQAPAATRPTDARPTDARPTDARPSDARPSVRPDGTTIDLTDGALHAKAVARAQTMLAGHHTGVEGREAEYSRAVVDIARTFSHTQGYEHQVNDALVKMWLTSIRFASKYDLLEDYVAESVAVMAPILARMKQTIELSGERDVALEAICGWSTCHHQLVLTDTHKATSSRSFLSPFEPVLGAARKIGQFDFDETYVIEQFYLPRARGLGEVIGVQIDATWDPTTRIITIALTD